MAAAVTRNRTRRVAVVAVLLLVAALTGCTAAAERPASHADTLEAAIRSLPGVEGVSVNDRGNTGGPLPDVVIYVPQATPQHIIEVVNTINRDRSGHPADDGQLVEFRVNEDGFVNVTRNSALDGPQIADDVVRLRQLATTVSADHITWHRGDGTPASSLDLWMVDTPVAATFTAIRRDLGTERITVALRPANDSSSPIRTADAISAPIWTVAFPFTREQEIDVGGQLAAQPVPKIQAVTIGDNAVITALNVTVSSPEAAHDELMNVMATVGAGPHQRLELKWRTEGHAYADPTATSRVVTIGACNYPIGRDRDDPSNELQQRLRKQFDTCPR
jgi:hypothetical protein